MDAAIYHGHVAHMRLRPFRHGFRYRVASFLIDLDRLAALDASARLFAYNRAGLFAFYDRDHGARDGSPLRPWIEARLAEAGLERPARIRALCLPRILGYVFNPLTVYFCDDAQGRPSALVYEVKNTFGGQHAYVTPLQPAQGPTLAEHVHDKRFFVSPFIEMAARYRFKTAQPGAKLALMIREATPEGPTLIATWTGRRRAFGDAGLIRVALGFPLLSFKIIAAIHWQAARLWLKGARFHSPSAGPQTVDEAPYPLATRSRGG